MLGGVLVNITFFWWTAPVRPDVEVPAPGPIVVDGETTSLPQARLERRDGYWFFAHKGDALTMGVEHAALGEFMTQRIETQMFDDLGRRAPGLVKLVLPGLLMWEYRHMPAQLSTPRLEEMYGFAQTYADRRPFPLNSYRRGFYYHALHDITQELIGNRWVDPGIAGACTGFAASGSGPRTATSSPGATSTSRSSRSSTPRRSSISTPVATRSPCCRSPGWPCSGSSRA